MPVSSGELEMNGYKIVNRKFNTTVRPLFAAAGILCAIAPTKAAQQPPNIVFVFMDNLGYGELGAYGGGILRGAPTPRICRQARSRWRDAWVVGPAGARPTSTPAFVLCEPLSSVESNRLLATSAAIPCQLDVFVS